MKKMKLKEFFIATLTAPVLIAYVSAEEIGKIPSN